MTLFPHLVNQLADNGTLAVQMLDNCGWNLPYPDASGCQRDGGCRPWTPAVTPPAAWVRSAQPPWLRSLISGAPPIFIPLLLIRRLSTGCRATGLRPIRQAWTSAGRKRASHIANCIAGRTLPKSQCNGRCSCVSHGCLSWRERSPPDRWDRWAEKRRMKGVKGTAIPS